MQSQCPESCQKPQKQENLGTSMPQTSGLTGNSLDVVIGHLRTRNHSNIDDFSLGVYGNCIWCTAYGMYTAPAVV